MPLPGDNLRGTEKDGSKNPDYCIYCYKDSAFVNPDMTLDQMAVFIKQKMAEMRIDQPSIDNAVRALPFLKRWKKNGIPADAS